MIFFIVGLVFAVVGEAPRNVYHFDFRDGKFDEQLLRLVGSEDAIVWESIEREADGLRMTLPMDASVGMVGVANRFEIEGDFEVTAVYEIVRCGSPSRGYGVGPGIYIKSLSAGENSAVLAHLNRVKEGNVHSAYFATIRPDGSRWHQPFFESTDAVGGVFRLVRSGGTLKYYVAETETEDFQLLREVSFGSEDVSIVRLGVDRGGANSAVEVVWKTFSVRTKAPSRTIPLKPIAMGLGVALVGAFFWLLSRKRYRNSGETSSPDASIDA